MKVKITGHTDTNSTPWWYADRIGETFEAFHDEKKPGYFYTMIEFEEELQKHHIKVEDCEVIA